MIFLLKKSLKLDDFLKMNIMTEYSIKNLFFIFGKKSPKKTWVLIRIDYEKKI